MCELLVFICKSNNELEKVMENVVNIDFCDGKIYLMDLLGE